MSLELTRSELQFASSERHRPPPDEETGRAEDGQVDRDVGVFEGGLGAVERPDSVVVVEVVVKVRGADGDGLVLDAGSGDLAGVVAERRDGGEAEGGCGAVLVEFAEEGPVVVEDGRRDGEGVVLVARVDYNVVVVILRKTK